MTECANHSARSFELVSFDRERPECVLSPTNRQNRTSGHSETDRLVRALALTTFLLWVGASSILPLLPEFLRRHGSSDATVGVVMSSYFVAALFCQYPAGWLADRFGRRPVLLSGLVIYAVGSVGFVAPVSPTADIAFRATQGIGAGTFEVAALALISGSVIIERRGRAFSAIYGCQLAGMAIGPLAGSLVGVGSMDVMFIAAAATALVASVPALRGTAIAAHDVMQRSVGNPVLMRRLPQFSATILGALAIAAAIGLVIGVYESCWTLLLDFRRAKDWQIGASWTLFALPFAAMSKPGGWLADHFDRRWLVIGSIAISISFCATYPFLHSLVWLISLGSVESLGMSLCLPAVQSILTQSSPPAEVGRVQGMFSTAETGAIALSTGVGGALFGIAVWMPFVMGAAGACALAVGAVFSWRGVVGRASNVALPANSAVHLA